MPDKKVYIYGFDYVPPAPSKLDERYLVQPKPVLDPTTGETHIDESDKIDLVELAESYKDQCGLEFMLRQMKLGVVTPESLADDGKHSGDATYPTDINDAYRALLEENDKKARLAAALGLKVDELTEEKITAAIAEINQKKDEAKEVKEDE